VMDDVYAYAYAFSSAFSLDISISISSLKFVAFPFDNQNMSSRFLSRATQRGLSPTQLSRIQIENE